MTYPSLSSHSNNRFSYKQPDTIQNARWPTVSPSQPSLSAARDYVRATTAAITSAEAAQLKKKDKGKTITFDPKRPKKLTIYMAAKYPSWQEKYIDLVREEFAKTHLKDDKELVTRVGKMGETKKAMPFVQALKRRLLQGGERPEIVFDRKLAFDEAKVLKEMAAGLRRTTGCKVVELVKVNEGAKGGEVILGEGAGERRDALGPAAEGAVPGSPGFYFENIKD